MTITLVQQKTGSASSLSFTTPTTAGNLVVAGYTDPNGPTAVSGAKLGGAAGNFVQAKSQLSTYLAALWIDPNCAGGQTAVALTLTGSANFPTMWIAEFSGVATSSPLDKTAGASGSASSWSSGSTATTTQASELWLGAAGGVNAGPASPWTNFTVPDGTGNDGIYGYDIVSSTGAAAYAGASGSSAWTAIVVTLKAAATSTVSPFAVPRIGRGRPAAIRGTGRGSPRTPVTIFPGPPFQKPVRPSKGAQAAVRGSGKGEPGKFTPPPPPSPFYLPTHPAKGAVALRGRSIANAGAPYVAFPSPFPAPQGPALGASAAVRGRGRGSPGARFVLIRTSPFALPKGPARGRMIATRGRGSAGSATGRGAPFTPRQLIVSLASQAGTDDYGNVFPQGVQVGSPQVGPQVAMIPATPGTASELRFPITAASLSNEANMAGEGTAASAALLLSGPALSLPGSEDWVQLILQSGSSGGEATLFFVVVDTTGAAFTLGTVTLAGWTLGATAVSSLSVNGNAVTMNGPLTIPQNGPAGPSGAPTSYNQTWGNSIVTSLNDIIAKLGQAGIVL